MNEIHMYVCIYVYTCVCMYACMNVCIRLCHLSLALCVSLGLVLYLAHAHRIAESCLLIK